MTNLKLRAKFRAGALIWLVCLAMVFACAQSERPVAINIGGGFTPLVGDVSSHLNNGWHMTGGVGYNVRGPLTIGVQFAFNGFGVSRSALMNAAAPSGDSHVWSVTAEPRLQLPFAHRIRPYVVGGVGYYRRTVNFTRPAMQRVFFFDPFFGFVFPGVIGVNQVLSSVTRSGPGGSLGAGWSVKLGNTDAEFFNEARYTYAATGTIPTRMVPLTFGLRF
jgi:opacity protein-like surface antigen